MGALCVWTGSWNDIFLLRTCRGEYRMFFGKLRTKSGLYLLGFRWCESATCWVVVHGLIAPECLDDVYAASHQNRYRSVTTQVLLWPSRSHLYLASRSTLRSIEGCPTQSPCPITHAPPPSQVLKLTTPSVMLLTDFRDPVLISLSTDLNTWRREIEESTFRQSVPNLFVLPVLKGHCRGMMSALADLVMAYRDRESWRT